MSAVLTGHVEWEDGIKQRVVYWLAQDLTQLVPPGQSALPVFSLKKLQDKQHEDTTSPLLCSTCWTTITQRESQPSTQSTEDIEAVADTKNVGLILYKVCKDPPTGKKHCQYVIPSCLVKNGLQGVHDEAGHQGKSRTLYLTRQRFFWVRMEQDVRDYVKCCKWCVVSKTPEPEGRAPLESIKTTGPLKLACIDFWSAEDSRGKSVDILVVTDHFSKMAHAFKCQNQSASHFSIYGFPERSHSNQVANFESVTDYDAYVKRMKDNLKEALTFAQVYADCSRQRQADLYNRRTKGCDVEEGDQVLLAN